MVLRDEVWGTLDWDPEGFRKKQIKDEKVENGEVKDTVKEKVKNGKIKF